MFNYSFPLTLILRTRFIGELDFECISFFSLGLFFKGNSSSFLFANTSLLPLILRTSLSLSIGEQLISGFGFFYCLP